MNEKDTFVNVQQEVIKLIPSSLVSDIACFVFYDNHPRDEKKIDITVCTKNGEIKEFFQRDLLCSLNLNCVIKTSSELRILRNNNSELFYLIGTPDELFIISSKENLRIHKKLSNIDRYDITETACTGETCLKVIIKDDAVPLVFDANFESLDNRGIFPTSQTTNGSLPIVTELKRKLVEARYSSKCNEKTYLQYLNLHQKVSHSTYQNLQPATHSTAFINDSKGVCGALKLQNYKPWVKVCNEKIVIILNVLIESKESIENVQVLLNHLNIPSFVYTTKIFRKIATPPYSLEITSHKHKPKHECAIVAVMDLNEMKLNVASRIELSGSISYEMLTREYLLPFEDVVVSSLESMTDEFDVLSSCENNHNTTIAILAATEKTELCLRHIKNGSEPDISISELFCTYLHMERVHSANVIVYRKSPYHVLNGLLLIFHERNPDNSIPVSVHTRSTSQLIALLHCIYDTVPAKIILTTTTYKITSKTDELYPYNENIQSNPENLSYMNYATSILKRSSKILEHLDKSMIKMSGSKNPSVQSKIGSHIDLFAGGVSAFKEFKQCVLDEAQRGIDSLMKSDSKHTESDVMVIE